MATGCFTNYGATLYLNHVWGTGEKTTFFPHLAYFLSNATVTGPGSEPTSGNYQRTPLSPSYFTPATSGSIQTAIDIEGPRASAEWGRIVGLGIFDSSVGGNCVAFADLASDELVKKNGQLVLLAGGWIHRFISGTWSEYLQNLILDDFYRQVPIPTFPTVYVAAYTTSPSEVAAGTEPAIGNYARVAVANNTTNFGTTVGNSKTNAIDFQFPQASAAWGNLLGYGFHTADSGGTYLAGGLLNASTEINALDIFILGAGMATFRLR